MTIPLGELIRIQRENQHWSQPQAARVAGISASYWRRIEGGAKVPRDTLARMLYVLQFGPGRLRRLGYDELAAAVQKRIAIYGPDGHGTNGAGGSGSLPPFITSKAEAHLWATADVSEPVRRALILHLRTLLRAEEDPLARALLGPADGPESPDPA